MKKALILFMVFICLHAYSQEKSTPAANSLGFTGVLSTLADYLTEYDLFINPGVGVGLRYHVSNSLLLEAVVCGGYQIINYSGEPQGEAFRIGSAIGAFYWSNTSSNFSLFLGPQAMILIDARTDNPTRSLRLIGSVLCGAQYGFSRHFAVFGHFGVGVESFQKTDDTGSTDFFTYIRIITPSIGFAFYL